MSITIVPYIDKQYMDVAETKNLEAKSTDVKSSDKTAAFGETFEQAKKAQDLMAADAAIARAKQQGKDGVALDSAEASVLGLYKAAATPANSVKVASTAKTVAQTQVVTQKVNPATVQGDLTCSEELQAIFDEAASTYGVDVKFLKAVGKVESNFNPNAKSGSGATGIMQLMPATARSYGVTDATDPRQNIMAGAKLLSELLDKYNGDQTLALASYNAGSGAVARNGGVPSSVWPYVNKVLGYYNA